MPRKQPMQIGTCPDCDSENVKLTLRGVCRKCYLRQNNCARDGKEYIPYNQAEHKKRRTDTESKGIKSKVPTKRGRKPKTAEIKAEVKEPEIKNEEVLPSQREIEKKDLSHLSPRDYILQDLRVRCSKMQTPIDFDFFYGNIIDVRVVSDTLAQLTSIKFQDQISEMDSMLNELERLYQHYWEASNFAEDDRLKFQALIEIRREIKEYICALRAIILAVNNSKVTAYQIFKDMKTRVDAFYKQYQSKTYHADVPEFLKTDEVSGVTKQSKLQLWDVDILTDVRNDRHFTQSRWATSKEEAIKLVKDFLKVKRIPVQFKESDITCTLSSQMKPEEEVEWKK